MSLRHVSTSELVRREKIYSKFETLDERTAQVRKELEKRKNKHG